MNHTLRLIEQVERLNMSGEIGDGMVARLHELAALARLEQNPAEVVAHYAARAGRTVDPARIEALRQLCNEPVCRQCAEREAAREQFESECG